MARRWRQRLEPLADQVTAICGFFNDDYAGYAAATCNRFKRLAGLPVKEPEIAQQGRLF